MAHSQPPSSPHPPPTCSLSDTHNACHELHAAANPSTTCHPPSSPPQRSTPCTTGREQHTTHTAPPHYPPIPTLQHTPHYTKQSFRHISMGTQRAHICSTRTAETLSTHHNKVVHAHCRHARLYTPPLQPHSAHSLPHPTAPIWHLMQPLCHQEQHTASHSPPPPPTPANNTLSGGRQSFA